MASVNPFDNLPAISFVNSDIQAITRAFVVGFQKAWAAQTGETLVLSQADRRYCFALSFISWLVGERELINQTGYNNLLPLAQGGFLDYIGAFFGSRGARLPASGAVDILEFTLAQTSTSSTTIPQGTIVSPAGNANLLFQTTAPLTIAAAASAGTVTCECLTTGPVGNGYAAGTLTTLVNWIQSFAVTVTNLDGTEGGADVESDTDYALRLYIVTNSYSNAGSYGAYEFFALSASSSIASVTVQGPEDGLLPGNVLITALLQGGVLPSTPLLDLIAATVSADNIRDLCANVTVQAPTTVSYTCTPQYYIDTTQLSRLTPIQTAVQSAVSTWVSNNAIQLGGSINPSTLAQSMMEAGASYVVPSSLPSRVQLTKSEVPLLSGSATASYQGTQYDLSQGIQ